MAFPFHLWYPTDLNPHTHNPSPCTCGIFMAGALILQLRDPMSLRTADLGSGCVQSRSELEVRCGFAPSQILPVPGKALGGGISTVIF